MTEKQDLRVQRTRKSLNQALLTLMEEKNFSSITIQELADEAMINRATFYLHYYDKHDLLETCVKDNLDAIMLKHVAPVRHVQQGVFYVDIFREIVSDILNTVEDNARFFRIMFQSNSEKLIKEYFIDLVHTLIVPQLGEMFDRNVAQRKRYQDVAIQLIVSAIFGVVTWWITSEERDTPDEIAELIVGVVTKGPVHMLGLEMNESEVE